MNKEASERIKFEHFYKNSAGFEFLAASLKIFEKSGIDDFINSENFEDMAGLGFDRFNLLLVNLAIALELSLKGIYILRKYNIFLLDNYDIEKIENIPNNISVKRTITLEKLIQEKNIIKILDKNLIDKYMNTFKYLQKSRNDFIHFAEMSRDIRSSEKEQLKLIKDFFDIHVIRFRDEAAASKFS